MRLCFLGFYDPCYPRHNIIMKGLRLYNARISECRLPVKYKFWARYPLLFLRYFLSCKKSDFILVPEFCQKDVPLAKALSLFSSTKLVFDPLASRYETKITDWKRKPEDSWQARWNLEIDRWAFRLSDLILSDTLAHKKYYCQKFNIPPEKVVVLPVGFDDSLFNPRKSTGKSSCFTVLFYGSFLPLHGVDVMVHAARMVSLEDPSVRFRFVGSGQTFPQVEKLVSELGCSNVFLGSWIAQEKLPQEIASADVCLGVFGNTDKAKRVVPHKVFQAMAMSKPVITADTPAAVEFFSHRVNIFLCSEPFPESLSQAILELKRDQVLRERIAENGYRLVKEKYSPESIGRSLKKILEQHFNYLRR